MLTCKFLSSTDVNDFCPVEKIITRGTWVAHLAKRRTLDFGSGHLGVVRESPASGMEPAWDSFFLSLPLLKKKRGSSSDNCRSFY